MEPCEHDDPAFFPCVNEEGWRCLSCQAELGYRPDLDVAQIEAKVAGLLMELHEAKLVYMSNSSMGEIVAENVAEHCRQLDAFDQITILSLVLRDPNVTGDEHAEFWRNRAKEKRAEGVP